MSRLAPAAVLLAAALLPGCAATKEPLPTFDLSTGHFVGSVRTGPVSGDETAEADVDATPWITDVRVAYVDDLPDWSGEPVSALARHIFVERGDAPLKTRGELAVGVARVEARHKLPVPTSEERSREALWPGTTATRTTVPNADLPRPPTPGWERLDIEFSRSAHNAGSAELALVFEGLVTPSVDADDEEAAVEPQPESLREHVVLT